MELNGCASFIYIGVLYYCMCLFSYESGVPLDSPLGLYSGTLLGGNTRGILEGESGSGPVSLVLEL